MLKNQLFLPFLVSFLMIMASCDFSQKITVEHQKTKPIDYRTSVEDFKKEVASVAQSEEIFVSSTVFKEKNDKIFSVEINLINPNSFPSNDSAMLGQVQEIKKISLGSIENIKEYDKIIINFKQQSKENGIEKSSSFKMESEI